ncbi:threonine--tRNA ligase [Pauljensenia hongkongensis]|uniref:Threonine--tRNA ligase n=1 Tax=Pauljensenia hongkongensis TaxID=178339 RepID=A0A1D8B0Q1_9ACTO|nr:threonine--tRNA ligase [Pauljensenia hongkongensis]AOS46684.1 threonine--tRNA ligase [Pauljensenia hongkongensis]EFW10747.1 threonine--tRNA ligase [Actinomyces sp. oral taxon 178 str. F0338]
MPTFDLVIDGQATTIEAGTTGTAWYAGDRSVVAIKVDGAPRDLDTELEAGTRVEAIALDSPDGLDILRHSATHVLAQAVQDVFPDVDLGIGPFITDGFYYDFGNIDAVTPELLRDLEKRMKRIVKEGQRFVRREISEDEARLELADQPYKLELVTTKGKGAEGASVEVGGGGLTMYDNVRRDGTVAWKDLCRGPHLPSTKLIGNGFALTKSSAAYWKGDQNGDQLQRIYGTAWASKDDLVAYQERLKEAERRDHRRLGAELDLFSFPEEIGPGLPVFHPKGGVLKRVMEDYVREAHIANGFQYVGTPHISKAELFHTSGHLPYYADGMFPPMDDEGQAYYLKAMNCPMHNLIFRSRGRSYRELPLRFFEFGTVYRNEKSGVLQGLTRVRSITQDDSHSYCTPEQAPGEVRHLLTFVLTLLKDFGMEDFYLEVSTRDEDGAKKDKFIGSDEQWADATRILADIAAECAQENGLRVVDDPGGAAFYGPKISVQAKDAIRRTWQMSTIQYDFNQPHRFGLEYTAADGARHEPVMIHSAKFGAIERFIGVLTEHYAGAFPAWLAPVQVRLVPVASAFDDYVEEVAAKLRERGIRVETDLSDDRFGKKIRNAAKEKVPFTLIAGGEDAEAGAVSFRLRDGSQHNGIPVDRAVELIARHVASRANHDAVEGIDRA